MRQGHRQCCLPPDLTALKLCCLTLTRCLELSTDAQQLCRSLAPGTVLVWLLGQELWPGTCAMALPGHLLLARAVILLLLMRNEGSVNEQQVWLEELQEGMCASKCAVLGQL